MREERKQAFLASNVFRRRTVIKPGGYDCIRQSGLFANSGGTAEIFQVFVLLISGQRLFLFDNGVKENETMANK